MALYARMLGLEQPKINIHAFMGSLAEFDRGKLTTQQIITLFQLSVAEQTEVQTLIGRLIHPRESVSLGMVPAGHALTNLGTTYDAITLTQNLGFATIQVVGVTQIILDVRVNKIGTGTQSWQLWNDTDGGELAVIDDAGATGLKWLTVTRTFTTPLQAGVKRCRLRAKSTVAADDPIYFGATLNLRRLEVLTSVELHEILLLAEPTDSPYHSVAALQTRLGV